MKVTIAQLDEFARCALRDAGVSGAQAQVTADVLVTTDSWGVFTHGTKLLGGYLRRVREGGLRVDREPTVVSEGPAWAMIDAECVLGQVAADFAMRKAMAKARTSGIGYVGVRNSCHFGAAGYYAALAAKEGMLGQAMANDIPGMGPPGSKRAVFGTNPFAFAAPVRDRDPLLLDMALSTVAGGKVYAARQLGQAIPHNWLVGPDGLPTSDYSQFPHESFLATMAGHKGYGLALMTEILAGVLPGAGVTWGVGSWLFGSQTEPTNHGAAFLAVDVAAMLSMDRYYGRIDRLIEEIHAVPTAAGIERLMLPGEREWNHRGKALTEGLALPEDVRENLRPLAKVLKREPDWLG